MRKTAAVVFLFSAFLSACASTRTPDNQLADYEEKEYVTGSNIPRKDRTSSGLVKTYDKELLQELQNRPSISPNTN
ncbi:hypothetical protein R6242_07130 [Iodobacter sp. CM08]|uniref:hypothetical protein n=1 Tax=Iodobacter sp. CM08 TaxID=3085902 RepID=UPI002981F4F1|nr:hypothetical protein [Iodobacter sp. CM08]MDW5416344.1 hypothetical protein [Iodobacter sp. CM08]